ncbi:hypothetical protein PAXRUDRAFT_36725 [Paxillus rubicundulus Ve08.2h10]|uniref:Heterokaryon incompatibility domain-containing protein n=1 Tax=Paxillus rubicundulus Ve08.2h10 TaxID=930991 RepID=A0A0D0DBC8_9AGAM|nr:hypothetical protein PAXRUDRAFT_36725 [Paxillus rubicundulus Ve08.2h10]
MPPMDTKQELMDPLSNGQQLVDLNDGKELLAQLLEGRSAELPTRLIDTKNGVLVESYKIVDLFKNSQEYANLTQRLQSVASSEWTDLIRSSIGDYFSYATLSHRWGNSEPLHTDLQASTTYALPSSPGVEKLLGFCALTRERGFRWAWSDTCCIDRTSSSEVQESINSMFHWYRASGLTIVYLADVAVSSEGVLKRSEWFRRGWTLQELLAPRTVQFYKSDWIPYIFRPDGILAKDNDKAVPEFAQLLSEAARVDAKYLTNFTPGTENVREKLCWAAHRATTKVEDMAYCLSGIFGIFIPVLYGEKDRAFSRLQEELLKQSDDVSLFDWVGEPSKLNSCLASHPRCFHEPHWAPEDGVAAVADCPIGRVVTGLSYLIRTNLNIYRRLLIGPPPGHALVNGRLRLTPHAYFAIKSVKLNAETPSDTGNGRYCYTLSTIATNPVTIITPEKLEEYSFDGLSIIKANLVYARYTLVRLGNLPGMETLDEQDPHSLGKPFAALLLEQQRTERAMQLFRRIPTTTRITVQLKAAFFIEICETLAVE